MDRGPDRVGEGGRRRESGGTIKPVFLVEHVLLVALLGVDATDHCTCGCWDADESAGGQGNDISPLMGWPVLVHEEGSPNCGFLFICGHLSRMLRKVYARLLSLRRRGRLRFSALRPHIQSDRSARRGQGAASTRLHRCSSPVCREEDLRRNLALRKVDSPSGRRSTTQHRLALSIILGEVTSPGTYLATYAGQSGAPPARCLRRSRG